MTPQVYGDYLLTSRVALRSMAEVFLAVKLGDRSGRILVLKRAPIDEAPSGSVAESLRREAEVLSGGAIDGVAAMVEHGDIAGLPFVVLEHVKGQSLEALLDLGTLDKSAANVIGRDVARALAALHDKGWIHSDVTPSNVMIDDAGEATLVDLGIARRIGETREMPAGKPGYASPEAAMGKPARPSDDIYGWGVLMGECLIGGRLFRETDLAEAAARRSNLPLPVEESPLVAAALSLDPERRPTAADLLRALPSEPDKRSVVANAVLSAELRSGEGAPLEARQEIVDARVTTNDPGIGRMVQASSQRPPPPRASRTVLLAVVAAAFLGALAVGFVAGRRSAPKHTPDTTLSLPALPPRAEVKIDGRTVLAGASRELPIEPGAHKLSFQMARRESREFEFVAEPGDRVVVLVVQPRKGGTGSDSD